MAKESKGQRIARIKEEKSGLDVLENIYEYAIYSKAVDPEDIDRFKWYGLYLQNKNPLTPDDETQYFMSRIKLVKGSINIDQMRALAGISKDFAKGTATFTTRSDLQFHNIRVRDLPEIFFRLNQVGLTTVYAAGDVPRNIATCPVAGVDKSEIYDVSEIATELYDYIGGNKSLVNLPRKYKIGISGCSKHCMGHEIQDLAFTAVEFENNEILFDVCVGGGLGSNKQFSIHIGYVKPEQVLSTTKAVTEIYRDFGLRENRNKARLGHLINEWGIEKFKEKLDEYLDFKLKNEIVQEYTPYRQREHYGIHDSKISGESYVGCAINGGTITGDGLYNLADIMQKHGAKTIKVTPTQNFVVVDVPTQNANDLAKDLSLLEMDANPNPFKARSISCTGAKFCKYGISETKNVAIDLINYLNKKFPDFNETVSISLNGCPNSCSLPYLVDIGLAGKKFKDENGETIAGFDLVLGGNLEGNKSVFGEKMKLKIKPNEVNEVVENILIKYLESSKKQLNLFLKDLLHSDEFATYDFKNKK